jgi:hypothetical protein
VQSQDNVSCQEVKCDWCGDEAVKFFRLCRNYYGRSEGLKKMFHTKLCLQCSQAVGFGFDFKEQLSFEDWTVSRVMGL